MTDSHWGITSHVCRVCFGRILFRTTPGGQRVYRCSNCGVEREGDDEQVICTCGLKLKTKVDAGIRCVPNDRKTTECLNEIIAAQVNPL